MSYILNVTFGLGILLLLLSILFLVTSLRERFANTPQIIQLWGMRLEVSIVTLLVLIGVGLIGINIWFQLQRINDQIARVEAAKAALEKEAETLKRDLDRATRTEVEAFITLDDVPKVTDLSLVSFTCKYTTGSGEELEADLVSAKSSEKLKVIFKDLSRDTVIKKLEVVDPTGNGRVWSWKDDYQPLKPYTFALKR